MKKDGRKTLFKGKYLNQFQLTKKIKKNNLYSYLGRHRVNAFIHRIPAFSSRTPETISTASGRVSEKGIKGWVT